jgi:hypothetical protein
MSCAARAVIFQLALAVSMVWPQQQQQQQSPQPVSRLVIRNVTVVDLESGLAVPDRNVFVTGDRVSSVSAAVPVAISPGLRFIPAAGKFLIPGLWDMHASVTSGDPAAYVARGILGVREISGADLDSTLGLYRDIEAGKVVGPKLITGGPGLLASGPGEARAAFDRLFDTDADFVRFHNDIDLEAYIALAERTRKWRYQMVGPLPPQVRLRDAISLRQSSIEGLEGLTRLTREEACDGFKAAANSGVWFTPMLASQRPKDRRKAESLVRLMKECGAPVLAGQGVFDELQALVDRAGFTPAEALRTATVSPARFLGNSDQFADLVLLDGNPLEDIANLHRVSSVVLRGRYLGPADLVKLRRPPTIRWWPRPASTSATQTPAASSAKPPVSSAKPASPIR